MKGDFDARWHELAEDVLTGMKEWRLQHPKATLSEMERALDERLGRVRARLLQDLAMASAAANIKAAQDQEKPVCPKCGTVLESRGQHERQLMTHHNHALKLERSYGECPTCGAGFFPLDDELGLLSGALTPSLQEDATRLGTWMPFERAVVELQHFRRTDVSRPTVERITEAAGAAYVKVQEREVEQLERDTPPPPAGPAKQFLSVDGAYVRLVGGEWAEVKTLAIGEVEPPKQHHGETVIQTHNLSYFSRQLNVNTFQRWALVETHRRGVETAREVGAVTDGSEWCQTFVDFHRRDALRILDFAHAGGYVSQIGQAVFGEGTPTTATWLTDQLHHLKQDGPADMLAEARQLAEAHPDLTDLPKHLAYLEKREPQMQYPTFQSAGWPIGDGAVESANKLVVEARLKGSGMHWAQPHVDPMLALRNIACNDRWEEAWSQITQALRQQAAQHRAELRQKRKTRCDKLPLILDTTPSREPTHIPPALANVDSPITPKSLPAPVTASVPTSKEPYRPAANHPWRHMPIGRARLKSPAKILNAKT